MENKTKIEWCDGVLHVASCNATCQQSKLHTKLQHVRGS